MTWQQIILAVKNEGGFDVSDAQVQQWLLSRARTLNAEAKWMVAPATIGTTVVGQGTYAVSDDLVDLEALFVDGQPYELTSQTQMDQLKAGRLSTRDRAFAPSWTNEGVPSVILWPVPDTAGLPITCRQVVTYPEPNWATESPRFPRDFDEALINGAVARGLALLDERIADADRFEVLFQAAIPKLRLRRNSRIGKGSIRIAMWS